MADIFVYLVDMPPKVKEMVTPCVDGFTVYLNARLSLAEQEEAYHHALWHITNNDFEKEDVQKIECEVRKK